ncbi:hypothetical protein HK102_002669 [Quaeritorhiza haematococci]|nr:hypothetical protein HK102_002669 [Quaeritorhiza haematococci]
MTFSTTYHRFRYINPAYCALAVLDAIADHDDEAFGNARLCSLLERCMALKPCRETGGSSQQATVDAQLLASAMVLEEAQGWPRSKPSAMPLIVAPPANPDHSTKPIFSASAEGLAKLSELKPLNGILRVYPIGTLGQLREGKSTLENLILTKAVRTIHEFFATSNSYVSKTRGASFFVLPHPSDTDGVIVLVDFEGFGDPEKDRAFCADYDARLFAIAFAFLRTLLFNIKSGIDTYVVDRLSALKFVSDIYLGKAASSKKREHYDVNARPLLFVVLRDFGLRDTRDGVSAAKHYQNQLMDLGKQKKSPFSLTELFSAIKVHPLPQPVANRLSLHNVSTVPWLQLEPDFRTAFDNLAFDLFENAKPLGTGVDLDGASLAELVGTAVKVVNQGKTQQMAMTSLLANRSIIAAFNAADDHLTKEFAQLENELPLNDDQFAGHVEALQVVVFDVFTARIKRLPVYSTSDVAVQEQRSRLEEVFKRATEMLSTTNSHKCLTLGEQLRKEEVFAKAPQEADVTFPTGSDDVYKVFMADAMVRFSSALRGPAALKNQLRNQLDLDLTRQLDTYRTFNNTARAAKEHRDAAEKQLQKLNEESAARIAELQQMGDAMAAEAAGELEAQFQKYTKQIEDLISDHQKQIGDLSTEHRAAIETLANERTAEMNTQLANQRQLFDTERTNLQKKVDAQRNRADELQKKIDGHNCPDACFPGSSTVLTRRGTMAIVDVRPGDEVLVRPGHWEPIVTFYDYEPSTVAMFTTILFENGSVTLTPNHILFAASANNGSPHTLPAISDFAAVQAKNVRRGMWVVRMCESSTTTTSAEKDQFAVPKQIVDMVSHRYLTGFFSPVPAHSDTIVVDGVLCSVYAKPEPFAAVRVSDALVHMLSHAATTPLRAYARLLLSVGLSGWLQPQKSGSSVGWVLPALKLFFGLIVSVLVFVNERTLRVSL